MPSLYHAEREKTNISSNFLLTQTNVPDYNEGKRTNILFLGWGK
ncbi:hypothetical protein B4113_3228 [Geobacillus sp. B4113_201601]|nr:hypothetical protein B4113_3228 [Geobacillus sp. B4113_201601]